LSVSAWQVVFFGTPAFAVPTLQALLAGPEEVAAVVTQPDRKKGRGQRVGFSPVKETVSRHGGLGISVFQPETVKEMSFQEEVI